MKLRWIFLCLVGLAILGCLFMMSLPILITKTDFTSGFLIGYLVGALSICITVPMLLKWAIKKLAKKAMEDPIAFAMSLSKDLDIGKVPIDEPPKEDYEDYVPKD